MDKQKQIEQIVEVLCASDIVWGKYGNDTIQELAERIWEKINPKEDSYRVRDLY